MKKRHGIHLVLLCCLGLLLTGCVSNKAILVEKNVTEVKEPTITKQEALKQLEEESLAAKAVSEDSVERVEEEPEEDSAKTSVDSIFDGSAKKKQDTRSEEEKMIDELLDSLFGEEIPPYNEFVSDNLEKCKRDLAADRGSVQEDVESDTVQWLNATYALITETNNENRKLVGGLKHEASDAVFMRYQLLDGWGIFDQKSADESIAWLLESGHSAKYAEYKEFLDVAGYLSLDKEQFDEEMNVEAEDFDAEHINRFQTVYECEHNGNGGILAWDLVRVNQLAGWCYVAGFYTLDESLEIQLECAKLMQENFESWDDMMGNYLLGFQFWSCETPRDVYGETEKRRKIYNSLKNLSNNPYQLDFNMELERTWKKPLEGI